MPWLDFFSLQSLDQHFCRERADLRYRLGNNCDLRVGEGGEIEVVETDERYILRDRKSHGAKRKKCALRHQAVDREQCGRPVSAAEQPNRGLDGMLNGRP